MNFFTVVSSLGESMLWGTKLKCLLKRKLHCLPDAIKLSSWMKLTGNPGDILPWNQSENFKLLLSICLCVISFNFWCMAVHPFVYFFHRRKNIYLSILFVATTLLCALLRLNINFWVWHWVSEILWVCIVHNSAWHLEHNKLWGEQWKYIQILLVSLLRAIHLPKSLSLFRVDVPLSGFLDWLMRRYLVA